MNLSNQIKEMLDYYCDESVVPVPQPILLTWLSAAEELETQPENLAKWESGLEAENAELHEKLAAAIAERDEADDACRCKSLELARLKSQPEAGQWAVTCGGMDKAGAERIAKFVSDDHHVMGSHYRAVPLHAPAEDGPWVIRESVKNGGDYYWGNLDVWTLDLRRARKYRTEASAKSEMERVFGWTIHRHPVRLADVEREGEKTNG